MAEASGCGDGMGWHRVCLNTIVRKARGLDSERLRILPMGSRVNVVEKNGRRVRIDQPIAGWCSLNSSNGDTILKPLDPSAQKVAPTPRGGQAAVTNLESKVMQKQKAIDEAKNEGKNQTEITKMMAEKQMLEARVRDLIQKNEQQKQTFEEFKQAAEQETTESGTAPTNIENVAFRNGDAVMLSTLATKDLGLKGVGVIRAIKKTEEGEMIGVDYQGGLDEDKFPNVSAVKTTGEGLWTPRPNMEGLWLQRKHFRSLLPMFEVLKKLDEAQQDNVDLEFYKRSCEGMVNIVKMFTNEFSNKKTIIFIDEDGKETTKVGKDYAISFKEIFTSIDITG